MHWLLAFAEAVTFWWHTKHLAPGAVASASWRWRKLSVWKAGLTLRTWLTGAAPLCASMWQVEQLDMRNRASMVLEVSWHCTQSIILGSVRSPRLLLAGTA